MTGHTLAVVLLCVAAVGFVTVAAMTITAVFGGTRRPDPTPPPSEPFSPDTERAIAQNLHLFGAHPDRQGWRQ